MIYSRILTAIFVFLLLTPVQAGWLETIKNVLNSSSELSSADNNLVLSDNDIVGALQDALNIGSENVVNQLSAPGGFNLDSNIHVPLPNSLQTVQKTMNKFGMGSYLNNLETKLNQAAEAATEKAKPLFINAIKELTWEDAKNILNGPDDAATQYFKGKMSAPLATEMKPIVDQSLNEVGAVKSYNSLMGKYKSFPLVPDVQANLTEHVVNKGIDGVFYYLAIEEGKIRNDPAKRTTELLKKVFSR